MPTRSAKLLCWSLVLMGGLGARAQEPPPSGTGSERLERQLAYLEQHPFHADAFERAVHEAIADGRLDELRAGLEARLAADAGDRPARVLLARLAARARRADDALALLAPLTDEEPALLRLRGELELERGDPHAALAAFARALELSERRIELEELHALAATAWLRTGAREEAERELRAIAALEPESFELRTDVAARLADAGSTGAALEELAIAVELAGDDPARRVRAEVERGRLCERSGAARLALECYDRAAALVGPGHWQRPELFERRLALHRALGTLDGFADGLGAEAGAQAGDAELRRFQARVLAAAGRAPEALAALEAAARDFPGSLEIGMALGELLAARGETVRAIAEFERLSAAHPEEVGLWRRLGLLRATAGELAGAHHAWQRAVEAAPDDVGLCVELAGLHARFGMTTEAEELLRATLERAPGDARTARALAGFLTDQGRALQVTPLLAELERRAVERGDAAFLEELAGEWSERKRPADAARALEEALAAGGDRARLLESLAGLLEEGRRPTRADAPLRELFALERDASARAWLVERIVALHERVGDLRALALREGRAMARAPDALLPLLLRAHALAGMGELERAEELLRARLELDSQDVDALEHLARLAAKRGAYVEAIAYLRSSLPLRRQERREVYQRMSRLHQLAGDAAGAQGVLLELLAHEPESRVLLGELARFHKADNSHAEAIECLRRALVLDPRDADARLELAGLLVRTGDPAAAQEEFLHALMCDQAGLRARARAEAGELVRRSPDPLLDLERARAQCAADPERPARAIWLAFALRAQLDVEGADRALSGALARFPLEPALLEAREELRGLSHGATDAPFDARRAAGTLADEELVSALELAAVLAAQGEAQRARELLEEVAEPALAAAVLESEGASHEARAVLRRGFEKDSGSIELALRLALSCERSGSKREAAAALETALQIASPCFVLELRLGRVNAARHRDRAARESGQRLLALLDQTRAQVAQGPEGVALHARRVAEIESYFMEVGLERDFLELGELALRAAPTDAELLEAWLRHVDAPQRRRARALLEALAASGECPAHVAADEWARRLHEHGAQLAAREPFPSRG